MYTKAHSAWRLFSATAELLFVLIHCSKIIHRPSYIVISRTRLCRISSKEFIVPNRETSSVEC